jgi:putative intracellular protease/amidase
MKKLAAYVSVVVISSLGLFASQATGQESSRNQQKVLLFIRDGSIDLEYMLKNEAGLIKETLETAGFKVEIATPTGEMINAGSVHLKPDLKITDVSVRQYAGFILPCMAVDDSKVQPSDEAVKMVKEAIAADKPVAAQLGSIRTLAKAGLLKGKKYASVFEFEDPYFEGSTRSEAGLVRQGNIITSGICPYMAKEKQIKDGTKDLVAALIKAMKRETD